MMAVQLPEAGQPWRPPRITPGLAAEIAAEIRRVQARLADLRHTLEGYDQGGHDDPCDMTAKRLADAAGELDDAIWWLEWMK